MQIQFCGNCGKQIQSDDRYCGQCGELDRTFINGGTTIVSSPTNLLLKNANNIEIIYKGKFTYLTNPRGVGAWCYLEVLKSKSKLSKQVLIIATQIPDCLTSIINTAEEVASFAVNFFELNPANTTYIEHITPDSFRESISPRIESYDIVEFDWEESEDYHKPNYKASHPNWTHIQKAESGRMDTQDLETKYLSHLMLIYACTVPNDHSYIY